MASPPRQAGETTVRRQRGTWDRKRLPSVLRRYEAQKPPERERSSQSRIVSVSTAGAAPRGGFEPPFPGHGSHALYLRLRFVNCAPCMRSDRNDRRRTCSPTRPPDIRESYIPLIFTEIFLRRCASIPDAHRAHLMRRSSCSNNFRRHARHEPTTRPSVRHLSIAAAPAIRRVRRRIAPWGHSSIVRAGRPATPKSDALAGLGRRDSEMESMTYHRHDPAPAAAWPASAVHRLSAPPVAHFARRDSNRRRNMTYQSELLTTEEAAPQVGLSPRTLE